MRQPNYNSSILTKATRGLLGCLGLSTSPRRRVTPPPILLRTGNHISPDPMLEVRKSRQSMPENILSDSDLPTPVLAGHSSLKALRYKSGLVFRAMEWIQTRQPGRSHTRRLRVTETVSLGEKRFVAVIQIDGSQYLIGGGATNVALLAKLKEKDSFRDLLNDTLAVSQLQTDVPAVEEMREHS